MKKKIKPFRSDLEYLEAELHWAEARVRRLMKVRHLTDPPEDAPRRRGRPGRVDDPKTIQGAIERLEKVENRHRRQIDARLHVSEQGGAFLAFNRLVEMYDLDERERHALLLSCASCFSRRFEDLFGEIDTVRFGGSPLTVEILFNFLELGFADRIEARAMFRKDAALVGNDLVTVDVGNRYTNPEDLLQATVHVNIRTFSFMVGDALPPDEMMEYSSLEEPRATLDQVVLDDREKQRILSVVERHDEYLECRRTWGFDHVIRYGRGILMLFHGEPGTGKTMMAHAIAAHLGKRILNVDIPTFIDNREADRFLPGLFREARLQGAILFFDECEALFENRRAGNMLMNLLLTEIERFEGVAILATNTPERLDPALERRILVKVRFPEPDRHARALIWRKHLPAAAPIDDDVDVDELANRYDLVGGYIKNAVLMALAAAVHADEQPPRITREQLLQAAADQSRRLADDDELLVVPKVSLTDVVVPSWLKDQIAEIVDAARDRRQVLERWGIGSHLTYGKGIAALLQGPPGTGKTLCAEAIAGDLNRPLLTVSLGSLLSKWVGGTEQNLERLFVRARSAKAVLFVDEADSLLRPRSDNLSNRHDHRIVNQFLTLLERHDGVVLLATNLPDKLDPALARRLNWRLSFPRPDAPQRADIWRRLLPDTVPLDGEIAIGSLAARFELTGAQIRNAVFKAAFRASRRETGVSQELLEAAAREQAQASPSAEPLTFGTRGEA